MLSIKKDAPMELRDAAYICAQATDPNVGLFICWTPSNSLSGMVDTAFRGAAGVVSSGPSGHLYPGTLLISLSTSRV